MENDIKIESKGHGYYTLTQCSTSKQLGDKEAEKLVAKVAEMPMTVVSVNNSTTTMKINPIMRDVRPDERVYVLLDTQLYAKQQAKRLKRRQS